MLDIKFIRENPDLVRKGLQAKNVNISLEGILNLDRQRRTDSTQLDELKHKQNMANDEIGRLLKEKKDPQEKISAMRNVAAHLTRLQAAVKDHESKIEHILMGLPNLPHSSVPIGGLESNREIRHWGKIRRFPFKPATHLELAESLDIIDFHRASKITGSNFVLYKKEGAGLERALYNFMLDLHTREHGYEEVFPPFLVNRPAMTATGQLPKMEEDMYRLSAEDLFLIPTAEVPVTNIHRDEILKEEELPICYVAYTACFRREAGSYGKDTKGLMRVHQFDKVELVKFVKPENSYEELEKLVLNAERVFQLLDLPYRVVLLATGELSFAAAKCYDLEVYAPGVDRWLEVSSCSNFEDFQARRANIRFKATTDKKPSFVHTLNGSGVALARSMAALLENFQTEEGEVEIPAVLQPYMDGQKRITRSRPLPKSSYEL